MKLSSLKQTSHSELRHRILSSLNLEPASSVTSLAQKLTPSRVVCTGKQPTSKQKYEGESSAPKDVTEGRKRQRRGSSKEEIPLSRGTQRISVTQEEQKTAPPPEPSFSAGCSYANLNECPAFS